jgi:helicase
VFPETRDLAPYELAAFTQVRGLRGPHFSWGQIIAAAERAIGLFEDTDPTRVADLRGPSALALLAAARSLDSASHWRSGIDAAHRHLLGLEAAVAYAMAGNFLAAEVKARGWLDERADAPAADVRTRYAVVAAAVAPRLAPDLLSAAGQLTVPERTLIERLRSVLSRDGDTALGSLLAAWEEVVQASLHDIHKSSLLLGARVALIQATALSAWTLIAPLRDQLPRGYLESLTQSGLQLLLPSQEAALRTEGLVAGRENCLIAMPTSTGKTLLGQLCMAASLGRGVGLACYVAPYRALANQVYRSFREQLPRHVRVERAMGGYSPVEMLQPSSRPTILVATPERFDAMLRYRPEFWKDLRCLVVDEAHILEQAERGVRLEGILTRARLQQGRGNPLRLVLLSAVLTHTGRLQQWLGIPDRLAIKGSWQPTARRLGMWAQEGVLKYFYASDPLRVPEAGESIPVAERVLPWPVRDLWPADDERARARQEPDSHANIAYLCETLHAEFGAPVLCVCATRFATRGIAHAATRRLSDSIPGPVTDRLLHRITVAWPHLRLLAACLRKGVAYHNASLPPEVREAIEEATKAGELRVVVATTTLAEGVDLPFRVTVVADWLMDHRPISSLLFRNIAGRCGRAGSFTEGDTILYDNPLGDMATAGAAVRPGFLTSRYLGPGKVEVASPLDSLARGDPLDPADKAARVSTLAAQYLAAVQESPGIEDVAGEFQAALYGGAFNGQKQLRYVINGLEQELIEGGERALARRASPLALTEFGRSCVVTGLAPRSCRKLVAALDELEVNRVEEGLFDVLEPAQPDSRRLAALLQQVQDLPEAAKTRLPAVYRKKSRFPIKPPDVVRVISAWLAGDPLQQIFALLPYAQKSRRPPKVEVWLAGLEEPTSWDNEFDKFQDFISAVLQSFFPWVCRAAEALKEHSSAAWVKNFPWALCVDFLQHGVDTAWAVKALEARCPVGRTVVAVVGRAVERMADTPTAAPRHRGLEGMAPIAWAEQVLASIGAAVVPQISEEVRRLAEWLGGEPQA